METNPESRLIQEEEREEESEEEREAKIDRKKRKRKREKSEEDERKKRELEAEKLQPYIEEFNKEENQEAISQLPEKEKNEINRYKEYLKTFKQEYIEGKKTEEDLKRELGECAWLVAEINKKKAEIEERKEKEGLKRLTTEIKHGLGIRYGNDYILCYQYHNTSFKPFFGQKDLIIEKNNVFVNFKNIHTKKFIGENVSISFNVAVKKDKAFLFSNIFERKDPITLFVKNIKTNQIERLGNFLIESYSYMLNMDEYVKIDMNFIKEDNYE